MKLLIVINSLILAGAEVLISELAPQLKAHGIEVSVLVLNRLGSPLEAVIEQSGIPLLQMPSNRIYSPFQVYQLKAHFAHFDIVHTHLFPAQLWSVTARPRAGGPLLLTTEHNTENNRRKPWLRSMDTFMYSRFDHIVCNSEATRARLREWVPRIQTEMSVIPNGISMQRLAQAHPIPKKELIGREDVPLLISVARLQPQKDHSTLLRALAKAERPAHLLLVGEGELKASLAKLAADLGISERVHFLGRRSDVPDLLRSCDLFVHSTHSDGFCIAALEAMAAGLPVVATHVPGLADVIGDAGVLVPSGDAGAFGRAISSLLDSAERRAALSRAALQRAQDFTIEATAASYIQLYQRLIARRAHA
jgi:glycosyltransferase involved in cell wall biosynthesis